MTTSSYVVSSGVTSSGVVLHAGDTETVLSGGTALATTISTGGVEFVSAGGHTSNDLVSSGGLEQLSLGAVTVSATVAGGGELLGAGELDGFVDDYGTVSGESLGNLSGAAGVFWVEAGGVASKLRVQDGSVAVSAGGVARGVALDGTSTQLDIYAGGVASGTVVAGVSGGFGQTDVVLGSAFGTVISSGGVEEVLNGGTASGAMVSSGGLADVYAGATALNMTVSAGAQAFVFSGATLSGGRVSSGGLATLSSGATVTGFNVLSGGTVDLAATISRGVYTLRASPVSAKTTLDGVTVSSGGVLNVEGATVLSGATLSLAAGAVLSASTVSKGGKITGPGELDGYYTSDFGVISGVAIGDVNNGGFVFVEAGGVVSNVSLDDGNIEVLSGGHARGVMNSGYNEIRIDQGGSASGTTLVEGYEMLYGSTLATVISSGATDYVESGGVANGETIAMSGKAEVFSKGTLRNVAVASGGVAAVLSGGVVSGATVSGVLSGTGLLRGSIADFGWVSGLKVGSNATVAVLSGGRANGLKVLAGGQVEIDSGGTASGVLVSSGGVLIDDGSASYLAGNQTLKGVLSGSGALAKSGGGVLVQSGDGSAFGGTAVISGGTLELATASGLGSGSVVFAALGTNSATLQLLSAAEPANGGLFANPLSNFAAATDALDLQRPFSPGAASATASGGILTVHDGGYTARFTLAGSETASYTVTSDGHGGALVSPVVGGAMAMNSAMAVFGSEAGVAGGLAAPGIQSAHAPLTLAPSLR